MIDPSFVALPSPPKLKPVAAASSQFNVIFNTIYYDNRSTDFDKSSATLLIAPHSCYWMHLGIDVPELGQVSASLSKNFSLTKTCNTLEGKDTVSKEGIVCFATENHMKVTSRFPSLSVYWAGFQLDAIFDPLIATYVTRSSSVKNTNETIAFDNVLYNFGQAWDIRFNHFRAPFDGIYYFSFSGGILPDTGLIIDLKRNGEKLCAALGGMGKINVKNGFDLVSKSCFVKLKKDDKIQLCDRVDLIYSDPINQQISLAGFYFSPICDQKVNLLILKLNFFLKLALCIFSKDLDECKCMSTAGEFY